MKQENPFDLWDWNREDRDTVHFILHLRRNGFLYVVSGYKEQDEFAAHLKMQVVRDDPRIKRPAKNITFKVPRFESLYDLVIEATEGLDDYGTRKDALLQHADNERKESRYA